MDWIDGEGTFGFDNLPDKGDILIMVSNFAYSAILEKRGMSYFDNFKTVKYIIGDSPFMRISFNVKGKMNYPKNFELYILACMMQYKYDLEVKVFYPPVDVSFIGIKKTKDLSVSHSPFVSEKYEEKGTKQIIKELKRRHINYDLILMAKWEDCVLRKSKTHIFVDQIDYNKPGAVDIGWMGGVGKSGLEAMLLKCLVISCGLFKDYNGIPGPPIVACTKETFSEVLEEYMDSKKIESKVAEQYEWAVKYLDPDYQARNILNYESSILS